MKQLRIAYHPGVQPENVWPLTDVTPAAWLTAALEPHRGSYRVRTVVPDGYEAYVEISLNGGTLWAVRDVLAAHTIEDQSCWFGLWDGWPVPPAWQDAPKFRTPEGDLLLFSGRFRDLGVIAVEFACAQYALSTMDCDLGPNGTAARARSQGLHQEPSLWWPDDRAWVLSREVDADCLYLACSKAIADEALASPSINARTVDPTDRARAEM